MKAPEDHDQREFSPLAPLEHFILHGFFHKSVEERLMIRYELVNILLSF